MVGGGEGGVDTGEGRGCGRGGAESVVVAVTTGWEAGGGAEAGRCKLIGGRSNGSGKSSGTRRLSASDTGRRGS